MADGIERFSYRSLPDDEKQNIDSWDRAKLEKECGMLIATLQHKDKLVKFATAVLDSSKKSFIADKAKIITDRFASSRAEDALGMGTLKALYLGLTDLSRKANPALEREWGDIAEILCEDYRHAYLPKLLELREQDRNESVWKLLVDIVGDCDCDPETFKQLMAYVGDAPQMLKVASMWRDVFRKERVKVLGAEMYPENHDDKWKVSLRRVVPTRHKEYLDKNAFDAFDTELKAVKKGSENLPVITNGKLTQLGELRYIKDSGVFRNDMDHNLWVKLFEQRKAAEAKEASDLWRYYLGVVKSNPSVAGILRPLWPLISANPNHAKRWESEIAALAVNNHALGVALGEYFTKRCSMGLSVAEVDTLLKNAADLGEGGIKIMGNLRCHCNHKHLVSGNQKIDAGVWQSFADIVKTVPSVIEDEAGQVLSTPENELQSVTQQMQSFVRNNAERYLLAPACLEFVARNMKDPADENAMVAVCCVYGTIGNDEAKLDGFLGRVRALNKDEQHRAVDYIKTCFHTYGSLPEQLLTTILDTVEAVGGNATYFLEKTWQGWGTSKGPNGANLVNKDGLSKVGNALVGSADDLAHREVIATLASIFTRENNDFLSPEKLEDCVFEIAQGRQVVAQLALRGEKRIAAAPAWTSNLEMLRARHTGSVAGARHLQAMVASDFASALAICDKTSDAAQLYKDFVEATDYETSTSEAFGTLMVYKKLWLSSAQAEWRAEDKVYQTLHAERNPVGLRAKARKLIGGALSREKEKQDPLVEPETFAERAIPKAHALMNKFKAKLATIESVDEQNKVMTALREIEGGVKEDSELLDYFIRIAGQEEFFDMYHTLSLWQGDTQKRDKLHDLFKQYPGLKNFKYLFSKRWDVLLALEEFCKKENSAGVFNFLACCNLGYTVANTAADGEVVAALNSTVATFESSAKQYPVAPILEGSDMNWETIVSKVIEAIGRSRMLEGEVNTLAHIEELIRWLNEKPERVLLLVDTGHYINVNQDISWHMYPNNTAAAIFRENFSETDPHWFERALIAIDFEGELRRGRKR